MAYDTPLLGLLASVRMHKVVGLAWDLWDLVGLYGTLKRSQSHGTFIQIPWRVQ